jgi:hypothetical protein
MYSNKGRSSYYWANGLGVWRLLRIVEPAFAEDPGFDSPFVQIFIFLSNFLLFIYFILLFFFSCFNAHRVGNTLSVNDCGCAVDITKNSRSTLPTWYCQAFESSLL